MAADLSKGSFVFSYVSCKKIELHFFSFVKSDKIILTLTPEKAASNMNKSDAVFKTIKLHFIIYLLTASAFSS